MTEAELRLDSELMVKLWGVSIVNFLDKIDCTIMALHCILKGTEYHYKIWESISRKSFSKDILDKIHYQYVTARVQYRELTCNQKATYSCINIPLNSCQWPWWEQVYDVNYNTRSTQKSPVRQQNAWFDTKKPGSTQKCPVRHKNALPSMHQLTLPLSNTSPPPPLWEISFSNFIQIFCF